MPIAIVKDGSPQMTLKHQEINEEKDLLQQLRNKECLEDLLTISGLASIRQKGAKIRMYAEEEHYWPNDQNIDKKNTTKQKYGDNDFMDWYIFFEDKEKTDFLWGHQENLKIIGTTNVNLEIYLVLTTYEGRKDYQNQN